MAVSLLYLCNKAYPRAPGHKEVTELCFPAFAGLRRLVLACAGFCWRPPGRTGSQETQEKMSATHFSTAFDGLFKLCPVFFQVFAGSFRLLPAFAGFCQLLLALPPGTLGHRKSRPRMHTQFFDCFWWLFPALAGFFMLCPACACFCRLVPAGAGVFRLLPARAGFFWRCPRAHSVTGSFCIAFAWFLPAFAGVFLLFCLFVFWQAFASFCMRFPAFACFFTCFSNAFHVFACFYMFSSAIFYLLFN